MRCTDAYHFSTWYCCVKCETKSWMKRNFVCWPHLLPGWFFFRYANSNSTAAFRFELEWWVACSPLASSILRRSQGCPSSAAFKKICSQRPWLYVERRKQLQRLIRSDSCYQSQRRICTVLISVLEHQVSCSHFNLYFRHWKCELRWCFDEPLKWWLGQLLNPDKGKQMNPSR